MADDYDDGGFSGGNMNRPALRRLMTDIEAGKVDIVVIYKIDRLSRSLADFARMVDVFDRHRVSLSAVTQQIVAALSSPHIVQSVWDRTRTTRPDLSEPEVVLPMRNLAGLWQQLFPAGQCRLAQLLIERVVIADGGLEIIWRDQGWQELAGELLHGTIGAELRKMAEAVPYWWL